MFYRLDSFGPKIMTFGGSATAGGVGLAENVQVIPSGAMSDIGIIVGIGCAVVGLALQFWFGWKKHQREKQLHDKLMGKE